MNITKKIEVKKLRPSQAFRFYEGRATLFGVNKHYEVFPETTTFVQLPLVLEVLDNLISKWQYGFRIIGSRFDFKGLWKAKMANSIYIG